MEVIRQHIQNYIYCVYRSRYDKQSLLEKEYRECEEYILELLLKMKQQTEKEFWKKMKRHPIVSIMLKKRG